jgi:pimeloyl-ACP methyl ester carboxylesterase
VYGITRRGYGESTHTASGYDDQRLADDVFAVIDSLNINAPVLVGHSMAGGEMTTLGNQHSDRLAGLVYLDALGDPSDFPAASPAYMELFRKLPASLREPPPADNTSFRAYRENQQRHNQGAFPESELRQLFVENPDGSIGRYKASTGAIHNAIGAGQKKRDYSHIRVPVLAFLEIPRPGGSPGYPPKNEEERAVIQAHAEAIAAYVDRWIKNLKSGVPTARIVDLAAGYDTSAGHFVFLTREADVLGELRAFLSPAGADLSGTWEIEADFDDASLSGGGFDCVFKQAGERLTGSCQEISLTGQVKGTNVTWQIRAGQTQDTITYTGTMNESGTSINGRFSMPGKGGRFTASKQ